MTVCSACGRFPGRLRRDRTGLDHLSFAVADRPGLESTVVTLGGVTHGGTTDIGAGWILEFRDPDNIARQVSAAQS